MTPSTPAPAKPTDPIPPGLDATLQSLVDTTRLAPSTAQLCDTAPQLADMMVRQQQRDATAGVPASLPDRLDELSVAFNLRIDAARLRDDVAARDMAIEDYRRQLEQLTGRATALATAGAPGGENESGQLVELTAKKVAAVAARARGDRAGELASRRDVATLAGALWEARNEAYQAGKGDVAALLDAAAIRFQAELAVADLASDDPGKKRSARIAVHERHANELTGVYAGILDKGPGGGGRTLYLAGCLSNLAAAKLAHEREDASHEIALLQSAVDQATTLVEGVNVAYGTGSVSPAEVAEASRLLSHSQLLLGLRSQTAPGDAARVRMAAYQAHRDRLGAMVERIQARVKAGLAGADSADLAYATGRYLWIRLQIALLEQDPQT